MYYISFIISVNCQWSSWGLYSECTEPCGGGTQVKTRIKTIPESDGGTCFGKKVYSRNCNIQSCPGKFTKVEYMFLLNWNIMPGAKKTLRSSEQFLSSPSACRRAELLGSCHRAGSDTILIQIYMDALPGVPGLSKIRIYFLQKKTVKFLR